MRILRPGISPWPVITAAWDRAVDLLYPLRCPACGEFETPFCDACEARLIESAAVPRCPFCSAGWEGEDNCPLCFGFDALSGVQAPFEYNRISRSLIRALKYRNALPLAPVMARHIQPILAPGSYDAVFPVPLHRSRRRERGFNQAELLLEALAIESPPGRLIRARKTRAQYGLAPTERTRNISGAFRYEGPSLLGANVALLDDVVTTGATVNECARVLRDMGASNVNAIAFARATYSAPADKSLNI